MRISVPNQNKIIDDPREAYFEKLKNDPDFQKYVINDLFNMDDYANILTINSGGDLEKLGKELIIRQEVIKEINRRISPLLQE